MTTSAPLVLAPVGVRGMKVLEREKFSCKVQVPVLKVGGHELTELLKICKPYYLKLEHFKPIQNSEDEEFPKYVYMNPEKITSWADVAEEDRKSLNQKGITDNNFVFKEIKLGYDNWNYETIFKAVLPENEETVSGFSQIGHIIHLNLRDQLLEYSPLIGQVLLDKIKKCRTVVNKSNIIDNTYRNFSMDLIAGDNDFIATVVENYCKFQFDFSKVYWNPRLGKEHERILSYLKTGDILFDVFCGVGPFAVPGAKKRRCRVFANDLNPDSYKWLNLNANSNKIHKDLLKCYNLDGKEFICTIFKDFLTNYCKGKERVEDGNKLHVTMNLPAIAVEFLKHFKGLIQDTDIMDNLKCDIIVYVYCFVEDDYENSAIKKVSENFGCDMSDHIINVFSVRKVSPKKEMMRVTFKLTKEILFCTNNDNDEPPTKKLCVTNHSEL